ISLRAPKRHHLEIVLRNKEAPVGAVELLIHQVARSLQSEGQYEFSLGEIPFYSPNKNPPLWRGSRKAIRYWFHCKGLGRFKSKFANSWEPRFWFIPRPFDLTATLNLAGRTNLLSLMIGPPRHT